MRSLISIVGISADLFTLLHCATIIFHISTDFRGKWRGRNRIRYCTAMDTSPPLLGNDDLPGPMCLNLLASSGALCKLDSANAYSSHDSDTLYGRACIIATLLPSRSVACARTAAWVWLGGTFPDSIDIIAKAHYRTLRYG